MLGKKRIIEKADPLHDGSAKLWWLHNCQGEYLLEKGVDLGMCTHKSLPFCQASKVSWWLPGTQHYESCAFAFALKVYSQTLDLPLSHPKIVSVRDINKQSCDDCTSPLEEGCWFLVHVHITDFHFLNIFIFVMIHLHGSHIPYSL